MPGGPRSWFKNGFRRRKNVEEEAGSQDQGQDQGRDDRDKRDLAVVVRPCSTSETRISPKLLLPAWIHGFHLCRRPNPLAKQRPLARMALRADLSSAGTVPTLTSNEKSGKWWTTMKRYCPDSSERGPKLTGARVPANTIA